MKFSSFLCATTLILLTTPVFAKSLSLSDIRQSVVKRYLADLAAADYKDITSLFTANGIVVSTSKGKVNAKEFFYDFLPNVASANVTIHQLFTQQTKNPRLASRFELVLHMKDGEKSKGVYMDEFIFEENSSKLTAVYMFENSHFALLSS